jgi:two-component system sensor histidine kinase PilS (NtrC family)
VDGTGSSESSPAGAQRDPANASVRLARERRISYFMLFRLGMLALFTVLSGGLAIATEPGVQGRANWLVWSTLVVGYALTIAYARWLPRAKNLSAFAWTQTAIDIVLAAVGVHLSGGLDSGLLMLYPMAVLGAATMGGRRQTWAAAVACAAIFSVLSTLEIAGALQPLTLAGDYRTMAPRESVLIIARTIAALVGVTLLSSYLAVQLQASVSQVGNLRALNEDIVRSLSSGLVTLDGSDRIRYFNPAAREILALDDGVLGRSIDAVLPGLPQGSARNRSPRVDVRHVLPDGRAIRVGLTRMPLRDAAGNMVGHIINFQDVTQLHELGDRVRRNDRLAALGGMAASVAHEIRNPLAAISGSAELLATAGLGDEDKRLLAIIRRESGRLSDMVRDLLAFTRPRPPEPTRLDLTRSVRETTEAFAADPNNAGIELEFVGESDVEVEVDPVQLGQVLWNLMRNAAEAMNGHGALRVVVQTEALVARISITDHGGGIPPDRIESIFDPFFTTKDQGTGFGLAIVHRVVDENGGAIRVRSQLGVGSTFTIEFPRSLPKVDAESSGVLSIE